MTDLTPQQIQAAWLLANGVRITTVAKKLNVNRATVWAWRKSETFHRQVSEFATANMDAARNAGSFLLLKAMRKLAKIIEAESTAAPTPGDQIAAAKLLLEYATQWHVAEPLEEARKRLEEKLQDAEQRR